MKYKKKNSHFKTRVLLFILFSERVSDLLDQVRNDRAVEVGGVNGKAQVVGMDSLIAEEIDVVRDQIPSANDGYVLKRRGVLTDLRVDFGSGSAEGSVKIQIGTPRGGDDKDRLIGIKIGQSS